MFTHAIARAPGPNAGDGLTTSDLGEPDIRLMGEQHRAYVAALERLGLRVTVLEAQSRFPDGSFVEDTAVVTPEVAVVTRPGAPSRRGEEQSIEPLLAYHRPVERIVAPGCVDGGDVVVAEERVLIGLSQRTNRGGAEQLAAILAERGKVCAMLEVGDGLHLKSSVNHIGGNRLLVSTAFAQCEELAGFERVVLPDGEIYAANSLWLNDRVLIPAEFPATRDLLSRLGLEVVELDVSEFRKMDGGLTCLSIRI